MKDRLNLVLVITAIVWSLMVMPYISVNVDWHLDNTPYSNYKTHTFMHYVLLWGSYFLGWLLIGAIYILFG